MKAGILPEQVKIDVALEFLGSSTESNDWGLQLLL